MFLRKKTAYTGHGNSLFQAKSKTQSEALAPSAIVTQGFGDVWVSVGSRAGSYLGDPSWRT